MDEKLFSLGKEVYRRQWAYEDWDDSVFDELQSRMDSDLETWWNVDDFDKNELEATIKKAIALCDDIKENHSYCCDGGAYIELSQNRTIWDITVDVEMEDYAHFVERACEMFKEQTGVECLCLGRSGRHICVYNSYGNALKFEELCKVQHTLEKWVIDSITQMAKEAQDVSQ